MNYSYEGSLMRSKKVKAEPKEVNEYLASLQEDLSVYSEVLDTKTVGQILGVTQRTILNYVNLSWLIGNGVSTRKIMILKTDLIKFILSRRYENVFDREIPKFSIIKKSKIQIEENSLFS